MEPVKEKVVKYAAPATSEKRVRPDLKKATVCGEPPAVPAGESWDKMKPDRRKLFLGEFDRWRSCVDKEFATKPAIKCDISLVQFMKLSPEDLERYKNECSTDQVPNPPKQNEAESAMKCELTPNEHMQLSPEERAQFLKECREGRASAPTGQSRSGAENPADDSGPDVDEAKTMKKPPHEDVWGGSNPFK